MRWNDRARSALHEPLVHFLLAGLAVFLFFTWRGTAVDPASRTITITPQQVERLAASWTQTWQRQPNGAEIDELIRDYIKEEVYYREAKRLGLDVDDAVIRRRLRSKMEFLASAQVENAAPDDATLQAWLDRNPGKYAADAAYSFDQIYINTTDENASQARAQSLLKALRANSNWHELGDSISLPPTMDRAPKNDVSRTFGDEFANALAAQKPGGWTGPIASGFGLHLVRLRDVRMSGPPALNQVRQAVENDWRANTTKAREEQAYQALLDGYTIKIAKRMTRGLRLLALWLGLLIVVALPARADELRPGYLELTQVTAHGWKLMWKSPMRGGVTSDTRPVLPDGCSMDGASTRELINATLVETSKIQCSADVAGKKIGLSGFDASQTDVLVRVALLGRPVQAMRLTAAEPMAEIRVKPDRLQVARTYFVTGVEHILFGYDHLLFVISLVLLLSGFWTVAKAVTAFTLAHSITLIGTTLGVMGLPQQPVEALIALSIMFLAVEILKKQPGLPRLSERAPWVVAFLFGLLHGFGFAGALKEIGLPEGDIPTALLTFNLGVEGGQLIIVSATLAVLALLRQFARELTPRAIQIATYAIGTTASFWFIERTFT